MRTLILAGAGLLARAALTLPCHNAAAQTPDQIYQQLQGLQSVFSPPISPPNITVDSYNISTGKWNGLGSAITTQAMDNYNDYLASRGELGPNGKPIHRTPVPKPTIVAGTAYIYGGTASLTFTVANRQGAIKVTGNGQTVTSTTGSVTLPVGSATTVNWKLENGANSCTGTTNIQRVPKVGLGLASVPIVPLAVVYDGPVDANKQNTMTYSQSNTSGTTVQINFSRSSTTPGPAEVPGGYGTLMTFKGVLRSVGNIASGVDEKTPGVTLIAGALSISAPELAAVIVGGGKVLSVVAGLLGSASATNTDTMTNATQTTRGVQYTTTNTYTLNQHLGPGDGDKIVFIRGAKLIVVVKGGVPTTAKLFDSGIQALTVFFLKQRLATLKQRLATLTSDTQGDAQTGLDKATITALLKLDPQAVNGVSAPLDPKRYKSMGTYGVNGGQDTYSFSCTLTRADSTAMTQTTVHAENYTSGMFASLGSGVTEDKSTQVTVSNMTTNTSNASTTQTITATFNAGPSEYYVVEAYYDNVFGTVLFRKLDMAQQSLVTGVATNASGQPMAKTLVTLTQNGKTFATRTNAKGEYTFRHSNLQGTVGKLKIGTVEKDVNLTGLKPQRLDLKGNW